MRRMKKNWIGVLCMTMASSALAEQDPYESFNRKVFAFNDAVDTAVLKPVAQGYQSVVPAPAQRAVGNFFDNLSEIPNFVNGVLQGKPDTAATALGRFVFNTTLGIGGLFDVMDDFGLSEKPEDFGQTLAVWGVQSGPYLVLPIFGPSNIRDGAARFTVDFSTDASSHLNPVSDRWTAILLSAVDTRASLLSAEKFLQGDRYTAVKNAYLSNREFQVNDGASAEADEFLEDF